MNSNEIFEFNLSQVNKVKPKQIEKTNIKSLLSRGQFDEANKVIEDLSQENFEENEYFDLKKDERKLIKTYQVLTQYLMFSINHLQKKNNLVNDLSQQQLKYNEAAEGIINKQRKKIKELEQLNNDYTNNCMSMEFLIKHLKLDHLIMKLGVKNYMNNRNNEDNYLESPMNEREYEKIRDEVERNNNNVDVDVDDDDDEDIEVEREENKQSDR